MESDDWVLPTRRSFASFAGRHGSDVVECIDLSVDSARLSEGLWFVVADFEDPAHGGRARAWRFARHGRGAGAIADVSPSGTELAWRGPNPDAWRTSLSGTSTRPPWRPCATPCARARSTRRTSAGS
ncbi:hypothetical protein NKG05_27240 [Oerskovia sp. M15]